MTPKEKAFELYKMYNNILIEDIIDRRPTYLVMTYKMAKQCALITVDEILSIKLLWYDKSEELEYWQDVKKEIELI